MGSLVVDNSGVSLQQRDLRTLIARRHLLTAEGGELPELLSQRPLQPLGPVGVLEQDEAGGSPGTLADPGKALRAGPLQRGGDGRAGETPSLSRREVIPDLV